jgi:hypothetical protein
VSRNDNKNVGFHFLLSTRDTDAVYLIRIGFFDVEANQYLYVNLMSHPCFTLISTISFNYKKRKLGDGACDYNPET